MNSTQSAVTKSDRTCSSGSTRSIEFATPVVDLHREADAYRLDVEMPGVSKSGVEIHLEDGKLTITGHRTTAPDASTPLLHREREHRDYRRVFDLDPTIDPEKIEATMEQGLLRIHLRKAEVHQPRKITVH